MLKFRLDRCIVLAKLVEMFGGKTAKIVSFIYALRGIEKVGAFHIKGITRNEEV